MTYLVEYKGGWPVAVHRSVSECARSLGINEKSVHFRCTPTYLKRHPESFIVKVKLEE